MQQTETIFHKIVAGTAPAFVIAEDADHLAFLDIFPFRKGQTVIIPKVFQPSKFSQVAPEAMEKIMVFAQQVARKLEQKLPDIERILVVVEGMEIDYFHVKLIPAFIGGQGVHTGGERALDQELQDLQSLLKN